MTIKEIIGGLKYPVQSALESRIENSETDDKTASVVAKLVSNQQIPEISYSDSGFNHLPIDVFVDMLIKSDNLAFMRLSKKTWESRGIIYQNLLDRHIPELRGLLEAEKLDKPLPKWSSFLRTHPRFFQCKDAAIDNRPLKEILNQPDKRALFELIPLLKEGKMDEVIGILKKLNQDLGNCLDALRLPLSLAFEREVTVDEISKLKELFKSTNSILDMVKDNESFVDPVEWLTMTLKLIHELHRDGAWNIKIVTTDFEGQLFERWLISGFLTKEHTYKMSPHEWIARFSLAYPGRVTITRESGSGSFHYSVEIGQFGTIIHDLTDSSAIARKSFFTLALKDFDDINTMPNVSQVELERIKDETGGEFWKYNLTKVKSIKGSER